MCLEKIAQNDNEVKSIFDHLRHIVLWTALLFFPVVAIAKIVDCPAIVDRGIRYSSHANYLQAVNENTEKLIWQTELRRPKNSKPPKIDPLLEADVQFEIACIKQVEKKQVIGSYAGKTFRLNKKNGRVISSR
jgi:hypothetical protein